MITKNGQVYQLNHDEGRVTLDYAANKWVYEYDYRDHQGNLRLSFRDSLVTGKPPVVTQISEQDPWGLEIKPLSYRRGVNSNNFNFQRQERMTDFGLNINFFKYRPFDPETGRGWQIDGLSTKYPHNSPYAFSENKVINHIELDGLEAVAVQLGARVTALAASGSLSTSLVVGKKDVSILITPSLGLGAGISVNAGFSYQYYQNVNSTTELSGWGVNAGVVLTNGMEFAINASIQQDEKGKIKDFKGGATIPSVGPLMKVGVAGGASGYADVSYSFLVGNYSYKEVYKNIEEVAKSLNVSSNEALKLIKNTREALDKIENGSKVKENGTGNDAN